MKSKHLVSLSAAASILFAGCAVLPEPGSLIQTPKEVFAESAVSEDMTSTVKKHLPKRTALVVPDSPVQKDAVWSGDLDGDGTKEAVGFYRLKNTQEPVSMFILKESAEGWEKFYAQKATGTSVSWISSADITGDGNKELLVGWKIGSAPGSVLEIFSLRNQRAEVLAKINYHKLDVIEFEEDKKARIAIWKKRNNDMYHTDLLGWDGNSMVSDQTHYPSYFPDVADYYEQRIAAIPDASYYWYYYADALLKANFPEKALQAVDKGMAYKMVVPNAEKFNKLKTKIELAIERNRTEDAEVEFREVGVTMDIPREIVSAITFKENTDLKNGGHVIFVSPDTGVSARLFSIEVHSKEMHIPENTAQMEKISESGNLIYFVHRADKQNIYSGEEAVKYEQSYALIDHMISNTRPGRIYPEYVVQEHQSVIQLIKEAANKYMYVVSGGKLPEGLVKTFSHGDTEYRFMGSDLDTPEEFNNYLSESFTDSAIRSFMSRSRMIEHEGKLAQPNADMGSMLNYEDAAITRKKENGSEVEFDVRVPVGDGLSFEYVHVAFEKTKNGWRISSDLGTF